MSGLTNSYKMKSPSFIPRFIYLGIGVVIAAIGYLFYRGDTDKLTIKTRAIVMEKPATSDNTLVFKTDDNTIINTSNSELYPSLQQGDSVIIQYKKIINSKQEITGFKFITAEKLNH